MQCQLKVEQGSEQHGIKCNVRTCMPTGVLVQCDKSVGKFSVFTIRHTYANPKFALQALPNAKKAYTAHTNH